MNSYFVQHPEMILGEMKMVSGRFGMEATCVPVSYTHLDVYKRQDTKYPVVFEYAGQDTATVEIKVNDGKEIKNELIYGSVSGKKLSLIHI